MQLSESTRAKRSEAKRIKISFFSFPTAQLLLWLASGSHLHPTMRPFQALLHIKRATLLDETRECEKGIELGHHVEKGGEEHVHSLDVGEGERGEAGGWEVYTTRSERGFENKEKGQLVSRWNRTDVHNSQESARPTNSSLLFLLTPRLPDKRIQHPPQHPFIHPLQKPLVRRQRPERVVLDLLKHFRGIFFAVQKGDVFGGRDAVDSEERFPDAAAEGAFVCVLSRIREVARIRF